MKRLIILLFISMAASGCATFRGGDQTMVTQLQLRVGQLERDIQGKDQRISELEYELKDLSYDVTQLKEKSKAVRVSSGSRAVKESTASKDDDRIVRVDVDEKTVQQALKNAGYYSGAIDGKVGSGTKTAIYQFQKDNNLKADGLIGRQTWAALKAFVQ